MLYHNMLIYIFIIVLLFYVYQKYFIIKEGIMFSSYYFKKKYEEDSITINIENKTLEKDNVTINFRLNETTKNFSIINKKPIINDILSKPDIPVSKSYLWDKNIPLDENLKHVQELNFPFVVKPPSGEKGHGVTTDIVSIDGLLAKINSMSNKNVFIEEQAMGKEYRIMVINDTIIGITMKSPPSIIGDGQNSIDNLINNYNKTKKDIFKIHTIDNEYIKQQGYTIDDVLPLNQKLIVTNVSNMSNGSHVTYIDIDYVHPINIMLFKKINRVLDLKISGIDFICEDISLPYYLNGVVLEVNHNPGLGIHYNVYPDDKKENLTNSVIDAMFTH